MFVKQLINYNTMKRMKFMILSVLAVLLSCSSKAGELRMASSDAKVIVAYVTSWSSVMPDPQYMTHINYAFGHVSETFNGVGIANGEADVLVKWLPTISFAKHLQRIVSGW